MPKDLFSFEEIKTPPLEAVVRAEIGQALRAFQDGEVPGAPLVKAVSQIGRQCYEIRCKTAEHNWRGYLAVRTEIVMLAIEDKKSDSIPKQTITLCKNRLREYEHMDADFNKREKP
jgi:phage-related protein